MIQLSRRVAPTAVNAVLASILAAGTLHCAVPAEDEPGSAAEPIDVSAGPALALTPPMGFNDWNAFGCDVSEALIKETADFFVSSGLKDAGYTYVNIDDCWALRERGEDGRMVPDPVKFPSGIAGVADYVHSHGLKLGIYGDAGTKTCAGYPGSLGNEELDAQTWADWGVDYLKYDNCFNQSDGSREDYVRRYTAMRDALRATGRPIVYSMSEWGTSQPWEWAGEVAQLWRTTGDINDNWPSIRSIIAFNSTIGQFAGPGHWNDPDMLEVGNGGMTATEYRTHMGMWAMMAAPLIIGTDLREATAETLAILGNRDIIAVDQDRLGRPATVVSNGQGLMVLDKPLADGDRAIALYNSTDALAVVGVPVGDTGLARARAYRLRDLWSGATLQARSTIAAGVPAHGSVIYRVRAARDPSELAPSVVVGASLGTLIAGAADGVVLTATATNRGVGVARDVALSVNVPAGWTVTAPRTRPDCLDTDASLGRSWTIRVPEGTAAGKYPITVSATYEWGRWRDHRVATTTVELGGVVVVAPLDGTSPLSRLTAVNASNAVGPVETDMSNGGSNPGDGSLITIGGSVYTRGLGTYAASRILYYLGGRCSSLSVDVGIDDASATGAASFTIRADDAVVAESGAVTAADGPRRLTADLTGATWLELVAEPDADSSTADPADWAAPALVCGDSTDPTAPELTLFSFEAGTESFTIANPNDGGTMAQSAAFHTDGAQGLEVVSPHDGNWFGKVFAEPIDLSGASRLKFDVSTGTNGTSGEIAIQVGSQYSWCQGGNWTWTNPNSSKTIQATFAELNCPAGVTVDPADIRAVWLFLKDGTFHVDNVRAE